MPEDDRTASRGSINFSYPRNTGANSPSPPPVSFVGRDVSTPPPVTHDRPMETGIQRSASQSSRKPGKKRSTGFSGGERNAGGISHPGTAVAAAQAASLHKDDATHGQSHGAARNSVIDGHALAHAALQQSHRPSKQPVAPVSEPREETDVETPADDAGLKPVGRLSDDSSSRLMEQTKTIHSLPSEEPPTVTVIPSHQPSLLQKTSDNPLSPELESTQPHCRQSTSPPMSARFSNRLSVVGIGEPHNPPPRSVSPAKPALKHNAKASLSPDGRAGHVTRHGQAVSEISDGTSVASDEGSRLGAKRKPAKVSFDDEAEIVGVAASPPTSPEDPLPESPPGKSKSKAGWFGIGKKKHPHRENFGDDEFDDVLKPRPALPSFGSIRGSREIDQKDPVFRRLSDNESSSSDDIVTGLPFSSDHALGGLLKDTRPKDEQPTEYDHQPTPMANHDDRHDTPDVEDSFPAEANARSPDTMPPDRNQETPTTDLGEGPTEAATALSKPTSESPPKDAGGKKPSLELYRVPGGFPRTSLDLDHKASLAKTNRSIGGSNDATVADKSSRRKSDGSVTDESGDSVYSDASEDVDGDGFGSINAIVSEPSKSTGRATEEVQPELSNEADRSLTPVPESAVEQPPDSPASDTPLPPLCSPQPPIPPKSQARAFASTARSKRTVSVDAYGDRRRSYALPSDATDGLPLQTPGAAFESRQKPNQGRSRRPMSVGPLPREEVGRDELREQVKRFHPQTGSPSNVTRPTSNGSDSSSSFKRTGSPKGNSLQRTLGSGFQSLRGSPSNGSASPTGGRQRPVSSGSPKMRTTLRSSGRSGKTFFSTGKSPRRATKPSAMLKSRFGDSDDEGDGSSPRAFRSRFADSSDDEGTVSHTLSPVRGIPRRQGANDGDSTELEDSSEDEALPAPRPMATKRPARPTASTAPTDNSGLAAVARSRGITREELVDFMLQPPKERKPSLLSRLTMKKPKEVDGRLHKSNLDSASRWDAALEPPAGRNKPREDPTSNGHGASVVTTVSTNNSQPSPKLNKRGTKKYSMADNWSMGPKPKETSSPEPPEPNTPTRSPAYQTRASMDRNRNPSGQASRPADLPQPPERSTSALDVVISPTGRKKRFPALRKALGLRS